MNPREIYIFNSVVQQIKRFTNILDSMGIYDALRECGIQNGDTIIVAGIELMYDEEYY